MNKNGNEKKQILLPKTLGACADLLYKTREARYKIQHEVTKMHELESAIEDHLRDQLPMIEQTSVGGSVGRAELVSKVKPVVDDWDRFYAFVRKNNAFEMMTRKINEKSLREYAEENKKRVPGTSVMHYTDVSCTAVRK